MPAYVSQSSCVMSKAIAKQLSPRGHAQDSTNFITEAHSKHLGNQPRREGQPISYHYYTTLVNRWVTDIGLDKTQYGTHSLRRTKASLIYAKTKNLRAIQLLLGHAKLESTIEYLGVEIEDALRISESCDT